ncbi:MAG: hypothetical protein ABWK04_03350 [Hydrogenobacter sp.]
MDSKEEVKELIAYYKHLFSHVWNAFLLLTGGLAGLVFKWDSLVAKVVFFMGGVWWMLLFSLSLVLETTCL